MIAGCWLRPVDGGPRVRVGAAGLMIGRDPLCDLIVDDPSASRTHAFVRVAGESVEVLPLGRLATSVNGAPIDRRAALGAGDRLTVPGGTFVVMVDEGVPGRRANWAMEVDGALLVGVARTAITLGSGPGDVVQLPGLPEEAVSVWPVDDGLVVEVAVAAKLGGRRLEGGDVEQVRPDDVLELSGHRICFRSDGAAAGSTAAPETAPPVRMALEFAPVGGRLVVELRHRRVSLTLSELRARLMATLLEPPGEYEAGDYVPDELVLTAVWPGQPDKDRTHVNTLLHRVRKSLAAAGVSPQQVVERAPSGGGTRVRLAKGGTASVR